MSKLTREDIQEMFKAFAEQLGLSYSVDDEAIMGGKIFRDYSPNVDDVVEQVTKETKKFTFAEYNPAQGYLFWSPRCGLSKVAEEATVLGKVNAIADHLGVVFEVQPKQVVATPTKVKAVKKQVVKKSKVTTKKGEK